MAYATKNYQTDGGDTWVVGGKMIFEEGATVEGLNGGGGSSYTLPTASASTLGGVKVGSGLTITDGVLSADIPAATAETAGVMRMLPNRKAANAATLIEFEQYFSAFLADLKAAGIMVPDE